MPNVYHCYCLLCSNSERLPPGTPKKEIAIILADRYWRHDLLGWLCPDCWKHKGKVVCYTAEPEPAPSSKSYIELPRDNP